MTSNTVKENSMITKKDLNKVALRSLSMEWSWNYELTGESALLLCVDSNH